MDIMKVRVEKPNYTQIPNAVIEAMSNMTESEFRVVIAICRKTFGWQKKRDLISISQLEQLTGLCRQAVINGTEQSIARGIVKRERQGQSFVYEIAVYEDDQKETSQRGRLELVNVVDQLDPKLVNVVDTQKKVLKETKKETNKATASKTDAVKADQEFDALPSASESPMTAPLMSNAAQEFFKQFHRTRWATQAQRELFERTEEDVGAERMLEAVRWGAQSGISRVTSICTAARNGRKNGNGKWNVNNNGYRVRMLPEDRGVKTKTSDMLDLMRKKGYFDRDGTIQSDN